MNIMWSKAPEQQVNGPCGKCFFDICSMRGESPPILEYYSATSRAEVESAFKSYFTKKLGVVG